MQTQLLKSNKIIPNLKTQIKLIDLFHRQHTYLRISLTERCNLRCTYCMPEKGVDLTPKPHLLTTQEIKRLAQVFVELGGIEKIRLTGGEPTLNKDLMDIMDGLNALRAYGLKTIGMTTNGLVLSRKLGELKSLGLNQLNISLDTLNPVQFEFMTRRRGLDMVLKSIHSALEHEFDDVKVNVVVMRGINDDEIVDFVNLTESYPLQIRFIEYMPFSGLSLPNVRINELGNAWNKKKFISFFEMMDKIKSKYETIYKLKDDLHDTTKNYQIPGFKGSFGFITSMSQHFCSNCNRLRLLADGNLKVCLFGNTEVNLRDLMRQGTSDANLIQSIHSSGMTYLSYEI